MPIVERHFAVQLGSVHFLERGVKPADVLAPPAKILVKGHRDKEGDFNGWVAQIIDHERVELGYVAKGDSLLHCPKLVAGAEINRHPKLRGVIKYLPGIYQESKAKTALNLNFQHV